jgi:UDP-N-acetyl-alpha-D-quinovosamine dehydrogenase
LNALVTGATGFVGSALCGQLAAAGHAVRAVVRRPGTLAAGCSKTMVDDIGPTTDWSAALDGVEIVFHLAAHVHVMGGSADPRFTRVNVDGTRALAEQAARAGVRRLVFLSSIKVFGDEGAFTEESSPHPPDEYAISKLAAENVLRTIEQTTALEVTTLRPPLIYGPGVKANFRALLSAVARRRPLPLASIRNRRSLIFVGNLVDALMAAATCRDAAREMFLVSDDDDRSTPELVRAMAASLGTTPRLVPAPPWLLRLAGMLVGRRDAIGRLSSTLVADVTKIRTRLGWRPRFSLEDGLARTAAWYRAQEHA